ncbi:uncharacterized protein LOC128557324 [Mercenaria mercenaria]|uniref:uncharacterized protein LOC128557324 n=1 Tax=Mercenaria mercenaria TaxID=6596 RepID=UPI00234F748F|nr:uncharacterized protein LOC128557324 [Mercenaria mercenaria]
MFIKSLQKKLQITVMEGFNAFGQYVPPLILFPGERLRDVGLNGFMEAIYAATENGWMDSETFVAIVRTVEEYAKAQEIRFPIILFVDGDFTHMSLTVAEYSKENDVILYRLLPNATHIFQVCDIGFFSLMKSAWKQCAKDCQMDNIGKVLGKKEFQVCLKNKFSQTAAYDKHNIYK